MIDSLAEVIGGTVHDTSETSRVIVAGDYIVTCRLNGQVRAQHRSQPGTHVLGTVGDGTPFLAERFAALP